MQMVTVTRILKLRYSLFDVPFVLAGGILAVGHQGWPKFSNWLWIVSAMVLARCAGMAFNEAIDCRIDAQNPRTENRAIPRGETRSEVVLAWGALASVLFCGVGLCINSLTAIMGPILVGMIAVYSYLKRVTPFCHLFLGLIMAFGPIMAAVVITGTLVPGVVWLGLAFWTSITANDIIYGSQDCEFDRRHGIHSIPAWLGVSRAWQIAAWLHVGTVVALIGAGSAARLGLLYFIVVGVIAAYLLVHHILIRRGVDLQSAFLWSNKIVAAGSFLAVLGGVLWRG